MSLAVDHHSSARDRLTGILTTDFCPGFNRYVYWLKEPVGWFITAVAVCILVGMYVSPMGWPLAAGLGAVIAVGCAFPWLAVRAIRCEFRPAHSELAEGETGEWILTVRNRLPLPLYGLMVEGYLSAPEGLDAEDASVAPDVALASVPPLCRSTFRLPFVTTYRGLYPKSAPRLTCAFPFGIWTAKRTIENVSPMTVWPRTLSVRDTWEPAGTKFADVGTGQRAGDGGEILGVRPFRRGDRLRSIHWAQTARSERLVVCERSGPEQPTLTIQLDTHVDAINRAARENLAWRVRVAASLIRLLHARHVPIRLRIDQQQLSIPAGQQGLRRAFDALAGIPLHGRAATAANLDAESGPSWTISHQAIDRNDPDRFIRVSVRGQHVSRYGAGFVESTLLDLDSDLVAQLDALMRQTSRRHSAA